MLAIPIPSVLFGTAWKGRRTTELTELALHSGFRGIDTANQAKHYDERGVGLAIQKATASGALRRTDLFIQTKFTYAAGHDHRIPYRPSSSLDAQISQSLAGSLEHLGLDFLDAFLLHAPTCRTAWMPRDSRAWEAMIRQREAGRALRIGMCNLSMQHLEQLLAMRIELPAIVQNRCALSSGWDEDVQAFCRRNGISYQGFSIITPTSLRLARHALTTLPKPNQLTAAQLILAYARMGGVIALTGTTQRRHMTANLRSAEITLSAADMARIASIFRTTSVPGGQP